MLPSQCQAKKKKDWILESVILQLLIVVDVVFFSKNSHVQEYHLNQMWKIIFSIAIQKRSFFVQSWIDQSYMKASGSSKLIKLKSTLSFIQQMLHVFLLYHIPLLRRPLQHRQHFVFSQLLTFIIFCTKSYFMRIHQCHLFFVE